MINRVANFHLTRDEMIDGLCDYYRKIISGEIKPPRYGGYDPIQRAKEYLAKEKEIREDHGN